MRVRGSGTQRRVLALVSGSILAVLPAWLPACQSPKAPTIPSGGQKYVLSFERFVQDIQPILSANGCNAAGDCHGGGIRGTLQLSPSEEPDAQFDFAQVVLQVFPWELDASPILTKPLSAAAGGEPHSFEPFASTDDPDYQAIHAWIEEGEFE